MEINETQSNADERMQKAVENVRVEFTKIRTGKATPALLDTVKVSYYGNMVPIKQVATVNTPEPRLITIQPWEKNLIAEIEKAIMKSELGLNPVNDGTLIRLPIPQLTEERRKDFVRLCHKLAEDGRIAIRNVRRDCNDKFKKAQKDHDISEDQSHTAMAEIQNSTDKYIKQIDDLLKLKEDEVMEV